jgi:hypothetical protein
MVVSPYGPGSVRGKWLSAQLGVQEQIGPPLESRPKPVQGRARALEGVHHVQGGDGLAVKDVSTGRKGRSTTTAKCTYRLACSV